MFDNFTTILGNNPYDLDSVSTKLCRVLSDSKYLNINVGGDVEGDFWFCVLRCFLFDDESINLNALLKLSKYIRKHYKSSKISGNGLKYNEIKYRVTATSTFTGEEVAQIEFYKVCDEWIPLHYAYLLIIKHIKDNKIRIRGDVNLEVFAETEEETYSLGTATVVKLYEDTKKNRFYNIVKTLIDSYKLYMYSRLLNDYYNNFDSSGNKIYEDFLNNRETLNFVAEYNKAVEFITEYNGIDICDIPDFLEEIKGSRVLNENIDIDTLVGEDFYLS